MVYWGKYESDNHNFNNMFHVDRDFQHEQRQVKEELKDGDRKSDRIDEEREGLCFETRFSRM